MTWWLAFPARLIWRSAVALRRLWWGDDDTATAPSEPPGDAERPRTPGKGRSAAYVRHTPPETAPQDSEPTASGAGNGPESHADATTAPGPHPTKHTTTPTAQEVP